MHARFSCVELEEDMVDVLDTIIPRGKSLSEYVGRSLTKLNRGSLITDINICHLPFFRFDVQPLFYHKRRFNR